MTAEIQKDLDRAMGHPNVVYLGISGVLHPSRTLYQLIHGRRPAADGHREFEAVPVLERILCDRYNARIVLTSTQPWSKGLDSVLGSLGADLASRVIGYTYQDLTTNLRLGPQQRPISDEAYWRLSKSEIVRLHVERFRPTAWVAVDDEAMLWNQEDWRDRFVAVNGCRGLLDPATQDRLLTVLAAQFGAVTPNLDGG